MIGPTKTAIFPFFSQMSREAVPTRTASPTSFGRKNANLIRLRKSYMIGHIDTNYFFNTFKIFMPPENTSITKGEDIMGTPPKSSSLLPMILGGLVVALLVGAGFAYLHMKGSDQLAESPVDQPVTTTQPTTSAEVDTGASASLGGDLYVKSQDPVGDKLPDAEPTTNPIDGAYKNPFE